MVVMGHLFFIHLFFSKKEKLKIEVLQCFEVLRYRTAFYIAYRYIVIQFLNYY